MKEKKKLSGKTIAIIVIVIAVCCVLGYFYNLGVESNKVQAPEYSVVSSDEYARDGQMCISYRVATDSAASDDELFAIYDEVIDDDYYLHTVFFYSDPAAADGSQPYDIAVLEEAKKNKEPEITRP